MSDVDDTIYNKNKGKYADDDQVISEEGDNGLDYRRNLDTKGVKKLMIWSNQFYLRTTL